MRKPALNAKVMASLSTALALAWSVLDGEVRPQSEDLRRAQKWLDDMRKWRKERAK